MNYIKQLEADKKINEARIKGLTDGVVSFRAHLASSKFAVDPTIQVADVNRWLDTIIMQADGEADLAREIPRPVKSL